MKIKYNVFMLIVLLSMCSCFGGGGCQYLSDTVICHGDSVTEGYRLAPAIDKANSYPSLLDRMSRNYDVEETGNAGDTSLDGLKRFDKDVLIRIPNTVILMFGLNDMRKLTPNQTFLNMSRMIEKCIFSGIRVIVCTPSPDLNQNTKLKDYASAIRDAAAFHNVELVDIHSNIPPDIKYFAVGSSNHMNTLGHEKISQLINKVLR